VKNYKEHWRNNLSILNRLDGREKDLFIIPACAFHDVPRRKETARIIWEIQRFGGVDLLSFLTRPLEIIKSNKADYESFRINIIQSLSRMYNICTDKFLSRPPFVFMMDMKMENMVIDEEGIIRFIDIDLVSITPSDEDLLPFGQIRSKITTYLKRNLPVEFFIEYLGQRPDADFQRILRLYYKYDKKHPSQEPLITRQRQRRTTRIPKPKLSVDEGRQLLLFSTQWTFMYILYYVIDKFFSDIPELKKDIVLPAIEYMIHRRKIQKEWDTYMKQILRYIDPQSPPQRARSSSQQGTHNDQLRQILRGVSDTAILHSAENKMNRRHSR